MSDREYFFIHGDIFDIIQSNRQDKNISLNIIPKEPNENDSQCDTTEICDDKICKKKMYFSNNTPRNTLQRNRQKLSADYRGKVFDNFRLLIVDPPQKLDYEKSRIISDYFGLSGENPSK